MKVSIAVIVAVLVLFGSPLIGIAHASGTAEEAKAMVDAAGQLLVKEGKDKAFQQIDDPSGPLVKGDLYVFVLDMEGNMMAHGANKALIGKSVYNLRDADGKFMVQDLISIAKGAGEGWSDYKWSNPSSKKIEPKSTFLKKFDDVIICVGIYKG